MRAVNPTPGLIAAAAVALAAFFAALPVHADVTEASGTEMPRHMSLGKLAREFEREDLGTVYFDFDRDVLDAGARARLDQQARFILAHDGIRFSVTGHTDKVGNSAYNMGLGLRRANRVVAYLVAGGVARSRLDAMVSYGEEQPVMDVETRERLNRRVLTRVIAPDAPRFAWPALPNVTGAGRALAQAAGGASPDPETGSGAATETTADTSTSKSRSLSNAGRGNGDEVNGDPANATNNRGGDE